MFTTFDSYLPATAETGIAHAAGMARGRTQADAAALARRMKPC